jgi:Zn-dependent peptidase ImmA (M78 family)
MQRKKTKKKPFNLEIMGETWKVMFIHPVVDTNNNPAYGLCDWPQRVLWIDSELDQSTMAHTLIHEMFHAYVRRSGVYNGNLSHEMEEILADQFALILTENFDFKL